jgi:hypothetical protein
MIIKAGVHRAKERSLLANNIPLSKPATLLLCMFRFGERARGQGIS